MILWNCRINSRLINSFFSISFIITNLYQDSGISLFEHFSISHINLLQIWKICRPFNLNPLSRLTLTIFQDSYLNLKWQKIKIVLYSSNIKSSDKVINVHVFVVHVENFLKRPFFHLISKTLLLHNSKNIDQSRL